MKGDADEDGDGGFYYFSDERLSARVFDARERGRELLEFLYTYRAASLRKSITLLQIDVEICKACQNDSLIFG